MRGWSDKDGGGTLWQALQERGAVGEAPPVRGILSGPHLSSPRQPLSRVGLPLVKECLADSDHLAGSLLSQMLQKIK